MAMSITPNEALSQAPFLTDVDVDALAYVGRPPHSLVCPVCRAVFVVPMQTICQHVFCARCVSRALNDKLECPIDRTPMPKGMGNCVAAPKLIDQLIDELIVHCPNTACDREVERGLLKWHLKDECHWQELPCPLAGCSGKVLRMNFSEETCEHETAQCDHCAADVMVRSMDSHLNECTELSHICAHCDIELGGEDMSLHRTNCSFEPTACTGKDFGCPWTGIKQDAEQHELSCPLRLMRPYLTSQATKITNLEHRNRALSEAVEGLQTSTNIEPVIEISSEYERDRGYLFQTLETMSNSIENLSNSIATLDTKQSHIIMNEALRNKDELAIIRGGIQALRIQWHHFIQNTRGSVSGNSVSDQTGEQSSIPRGGSARQNSDNSKVKL